MVRGCEPSLIYTVRYYQRCVLFWVIEKGSGNSVLVEPQAGEMSLGPKWKLDVQGAEKERWATSHGWYHVD